jgi:hypothetical protein
MEIIELNEEYIEEIIIELEKLLILNGNNLNERLKELIQDAIDEPFIYLKELFDGYYDNNLKQLNIKPLDLNLIIKFYNSFSNIL